MGGGVSLPGGEIQKQKKKKRQGKKINYIVPLNRINKMNHNTNLQI